MSKLSVNFHRSEFSCKCGCGFNTVDAELLAVLENVRNYFNKPVHITSACRCETHNKFVSGSRHSLHKLGRAADIIVNDVEPEQVALFLESLLTHGGIGRYDDFTHVDTRSNDYVVGWSG